MRRALPHSHRGMKAGGTDRGPECPSQGTALDFLLTGICAHRHRTHQLTETGFWRLEKWRKMGQKWGKWGEMEKKGVERRKMGGMVGIAHRMWVVEGCSGMWLRKMGQKCETNFSQSHFPHFFLRRSKIVPTIRFVQTSSPHSPTANWEFLPLTDTHRRGGWCGACVHGHTWLCRVEPAGPTGPSAFSSGLHTDPPAPYFRAQPHEPGGCHLGPQA